MKQKQLSLIIVLVVAAVFISLLYFFHPEEAGFFPQCPFHYITGLDCPGCGTQRAFHSILHFEFGKAFYYNPLFVVSIPYLLTGFYFEYLGGNKRYPRIRKFLFGRNAIFIVLAIIILYWIIRNIPSFL